MDVYIHDMSIPDCPHALASFLASWRVYVSNKGQGVIRCNLLSIWFICKQRWRV